MLRLFSHGPRAPRLDWQQNLMLLLSCLTPLQRQTCWVIRWWSFGSARPHVSNYRLSFHFMNSRMLNLLATECLNYLFKRRRSGSVIVLPLFVSQLSCSWLHWCILLVLISLIYTLLSTDVVIIWRTWIIIWAMHGSICIQSVLNHLHCMWTLRLQARSIWQGFWREWTDMRRCSDDCVR